MIKGLPNKLGRKLTLRIILFSSLLTLLLTGIQITMEYRELLRRIDQLPTIIEKSLNPAIADAIWSFDTLQVKTLLKGVNSLEFVERSELHLRDGSHYLAQSGHSDNTERFQLPILLHQSIQSQSQSELLAQPLSADQAFSEFQHLPAEAQLQQEDLHPQIMQQAALQVATLTITVSKDEALSTVLHRAVITLLKNAFKTVLAVAFMLLIFCKLVTRHLFAMTQFINQYQDNATRPLRLERSSGEQPDELDQLVEAFNRLQQRLHHEHQARLQEIEHREMAQRQLMHIERVGTMGELATSLAHELNQPLSAILGYSDMANRVSREQCTGQGLQDARASAQTQTSQIKQPILEKCLTKIGDEAERASEIIKRTRAFVQRAPSEKQNLDLCHICQQSIELVQHRALQHQIKLQLIPFNQPAIFNGDKVQMQQVLVNLFINAIDAISATNRPGTIEITLQPNDHYWRLSITDNGPGISHKVIDQLFDPFVTSKAEGMGVGLAICRNIIEAFNGTIRAKNTEAGGACFTLLLPQASPDNKTMEPTQ